MIVDIIPTYYRLIFSNGYVQSPMWINQDYFKHGQDLSIEKYCKRQVDWNKHIGCIGYELLDQYKRSMCKRVFIESTETGKK